MGGEGSGTWHRFNKKTTVEECRSLDVGYLHCNGLLKPGHYFSLRWSRAGRQTLWDPLSDGPRRPLLLRSTVGWSPGRATPWPVPFVHCLRRSRSPGLP